MDPTIILAIAQALEHMPIIGPYVLPAISGALTVMGVCSGAAPHLPPPKKIRGPYYRGYHVVNFVGGNYRYASNALKPVMDDQSRPGSSIPRTTLVIPMPDKKDAIP